MRELLDALALLAEVITALPARAQLGLLLVVLAFGALLAGVARLASVTGRWCWRAVRRRRLPAGPVAATPPPKSVLDGLALVEPDDSGPGPRP